MDVQVIGQLVASLGFPIVACGAMFWMVNKQEERHGGIVNVILVNGLLFT